jgi:hypothetical protein
MNLPNGGPMSDWLEQAWLVRYLNRQLTAAEAAAFEAYMLDRPGLLDQVEADTALRDAVALDEAESASSMMSSGAASGNPGDRSTSDQMRQPGSNGRWVLSAASIVFALVIGWSLPRGSSDAERYVAAPPRVLYETTRGAADASIDLVPGAVVGDIFIADIAVPVGATVQSASVQFEGETFELPSASVSNEGFVTYVLPIDWQEKAILTLKLQFEVSTSPVEFVVNL